MTTVLLVGILTAFVATTLAAGLRRAPTRVSCPRCGGRTESVLLPPIVQRAAPELRGRWCPSCSWEGMGRDGAEAVPGQPMAHGSGFRWGADRLPEDFGFRFAPSADQVATTVPAEPPAHPSGFRFAERPTTAPVTRAHPSGFTWAAHDEVPAPAGTDAARTAGVFRWADPMAAPVFVWRDATQRPPVFRWKD